MADEKVLLVAAEAREFAGLLRRMSSTALGWPLQFARAAQGLVMVADGPGPGLAARAVSVALERMRPVAIVSVGVCGGLAAELKVGDIVVAKRIIDGDHGVEYPAVAPQSPRPFSTGNVISMDRVACTISDKYSLRARGGDVVEMEAAAVAERASKEGIPFSCVRSVSDVAGEGFDLDFNTLRDAQGRFSRARIILAALRNPLVRFPALMQLDRNTRAAAESLGDFLVDCRF